MILSRRNPLTRPATALFTAALFAWCLLVFLVGIGALDLPAWVIVAGPVFIPAGIFLTWIAAMLALSFFYRVLAFFARPRPRRP